MRPLSEDEIRASFVNGTADEIEQLTLPLKVMLAEWGDHDVLGWRDPRAPQRGYLIVMREERPTGVVLRAADGSMPRGRSALCALCHTLQPADQVSLFSARRAGSPGERGDSVGTYICADLSCSETVRLGAPRAPQEVVPDDRAAQRAGALLRRAEAFVGSVVG